MKNLINTPLDYDAQNTLDARTVATTAETPSYLVDKRLIDYLLRNVTKASLGDIKEDLTSMITIATSVEQIVTEVEEYGYMYKIMNVLAESQPEEEAPKAPVTNEFRKTPYGQDNQNDAKTTPPGYTPTVSAEYVDRNQI